MMLGDIDMKKIKQILKRFCIVFIFIILGALLDNAINPKNPIFTTIFFIVGIIASIYWPVISPKGLMDKSNDKKIQEIKKQQEKLDKRLTVKQLKPFELDNLIQAKKDELNLLSNNISEQQHTLKNIINEVKNAKEKEKEKYTAQLSELNKNKNDLEAEIISKQDTLKTIADELNKYGEKVSLKESIEQDKLEISKLENKIQELKNQIISYDDQINIESFGLYNPHYSFTSSVEYKQKLDDVRQLQKSLIKDGTAGVITEQLLFNNSLAKGKKVQNQNIKQLIRTFNVECEAAINKVTLSNMKRIEDRINRSFETLNNLNVGNLIKLSPTYLRLKLDELHLAFEYEQKKAEEKEILREQREKEKEERKAQAEALLKEKMENLTNNDDPKYKSLQDEVAKLKTQLAELDEKEASLDYRENHSTAGYVYIISNIGAFGKNVFKIGVTRRLEPLARIKELSSASVPFSFDVHALIFSDDAYKLETDLHNYFDKYRVNKVNNRKEFFGITINQVKEALNKYYNQTFEFTEIPEAEEYRKSLELMQKN